MSIEDCLIRGVQSETVPKQNCARLGVHPGLSLYVREELTAITLGKWVWFRHAPLTHTEWAALGSVCVVSKDLQNRHGTKGKFCACSKTNLFCRSLEGQNNYAALRVARPVPNAECVEKIRGSAPVSLSIPGLKCRCLCPCEKYMVSRRGATCPVTRVDSIGRCNTI